MRSSLEISSLMCLTVAFSPAIRGNVSEQSTASSDRLIFRLHRCRCILTQAAQQTGNTNPYDACGKVIVRLEGYWCVLLRKACKNHGPKSTLDGESGSWDTSIMRTVVVQSVKFSFHILSQRFFVNFICCVL